MEEHFKINDNKRDDISNTHRLKLRRVLDFLATKIGTTAELTLGTVHDFERSLTGLSRTYRDSMLIVFRGICGLAVEWGALKRNPFDAYTFPEKVRRESGGSGLLTKLDAGQVERILDRLKAGAGTWDAERLYAFAATLVYTGLRPGRLVKLEWGHCDLDAGRLMIPRGGRLGSVPHLEPLKIVPELASILAHWKARCPSRSPGQVRGNRLPYGKRWADDARTLIPDPAEHRVVEEMARWDREGWSYERIARELQAREIPTKSGLANWRAATVRHILRRKAEEDAHEPPPCPYVFPKHSGNGHWSIYSAPRSTPRHQLRLVGDELGIGRLTPGSLLAFHHANSRTTLDLETKPAEVAPVEPAEARAPVPWRGTRKQLDRELAAIESKATRDVVRTLADWSPQRFSGHELAARSGHPDAVNLLKAFADSGTRLARAVGIPGRRGRRGYWIEVVLVPG